MTSTEGGGDSAKVDLERTLSLSKSTVGMASLPKSLSMEEKKYLLAVERGDMANVRRLLQKAYRFKSFNVNCVDSLGRGALTLAIDGENLEMVELLVIMGVETKDALLHSINAEFVEAVELLLEHEELIHKEGEPYSWQKVDLNTANFTPDITPLILAAHRNNYEILKMLLDRGATLPMPHDIKCGCEECIRESSEDSLRHSLSRVNEYKALASPSLIALSSSDPILTAFQLSWELRNLAFAEQECKTEYLELRRQCQQFAVDLLHQSRSSQELAIILNHDPESPPYEEGEHMKLARLELAINYKQKKFVAHPNIQQLLAAIWYEGVPGFRRMKAMEKLKIISRTAVLFPLYCFLYMAAPNTSTGKLMRKPFMKFLIHASSYLFFLLLLILVSQRAEVQIIELFGTEEMRRRMTEESLIQRGNRPTILEIIVLVYVFGFIYEETHEIYVEGIKSYLRNMWNFIDFTRNFLYILVAILRIVAFIQQTNEIEKDPSTAYIPREEWDPFDPQLIAEGLFAAANIFSALKLVHLFSINPHLGPLQISLGRMVIDIVKFFFIYSLVLFAFACGLNQLLWYFAELERRKCYILPGGLPDWVNNGDSCMKWRSFANVFESSQSLFWASFGMVGLENFELTGIKTYTRFWGLLMFGSYSVINVIVLLNLLIAMMSNSYAMIDEHSDTEWKFARTKLWMSYFEESATLPAPFNIFPTPKLIFKLLGIRKKDKLRRMSSKKRQREEKERDHRYSAVIRALVWRYVTSMHRKIEESAVTEDDINEVKGEISAFRYEMLEVLGKNGMDVSCAEKKEKAILGKRMKIWERRLMKDFKVGPIATEEEIDQLMFEPPPENEDSLAKFRRIAKLAVMNSSLHKWGQVVKGVCEASQIGKCNNRESLKNQQQLRKAMKEAQKYVKSGPLREVPSRSVSPIDQQDTAATCLIEIMKDISNETQAASSNTLSILALASTLKGKDGAAKPQKPNISVTAPTPNMPLKSKSDKVVNAVVTVEAKKPSPLPSPKKQPDVSKKVEDVAITVEPTKVEIDVKQQSATKNDGAKEEDVNKKECRSKTPVFDRKLFEKDAAEVVEDKKVERMKTPSPSLPEKDEGGVSEAVEEKPIRKSPSPSPEKDVVVASTSKATSRKTSLIGLSPAIPVKEEETPVVSLLPTPTSTKETSPEKESPSPPPSNVVDKIPPPPTFVKKYPAPQPQQSATQQTPPPSPPPPIVVTTPSTMPSISETVLTPATLENKAIATLDAAKSKSTENLIVIDKPSSTSTTTRTKMHEVKPIYRQPKTGWL